MKLTILSVIISLLPLIACDVCKPGYFWSSKIGCNKCFCSGVTNKCHAGSFYSREIATDLREIRGFLDWPSRPAKPLKYTLNTGGIKYYFNKNNANNVFTWELPFKFHKNRARNYGCSLNLIQRIQLTNGSYVTNATIVIRILSSEVNISITAKSNTAFHSHKVLQIHRLRLFEKNAYIGEDRFRPATKADVMRALLSANKILVISNHPNKKFIAITRVLQQVAVDEVTSSGFGRPDSIEVCDCPEGYSGDSCESCTDQLCEPCKNIEPCEDLCYDNGMCLGCPQCFECTSYHRNINNKTKSVFGACESGDPK